MTRSVVNLCVAVLCVAVSSESPAAPRLRRAHAQPLARPALRLHEAEPACARADSKKTDLVAGKPPQAEVVPPSFKWALFHNWMYFLALGLTIPVLGRVISTIVNPDGSDKVSPESSVLGGDVESIDKVITFLFVGFLGALSDVLGRKALMAYSALGFTLTCLLQATAKKSTAALYLADVVDGVSSCMNTVCTAYVTDTSPPEKRAINLGVFQGVSVAGAFILGIPLSAVLSAKYGLRAPMLAAAAVGFVNFLVVVFLTPESLPASQRMGKKLDLASANPVGALKLLFTRSPLLRGSAAAFAMLWLSNTCVNAVFGNYVNHLFGWGPEESGPLLVLVGIVLAVAPRMLVPRLGLRRSMLIGTGWYALGQLATAFAHTPSRLVSSILFMSVGCIGTVSLVAFISNQAEPAERGALLGAVETLQELCEAVGHSGYGRLFAYFISDAAPVRLPGAPFIAAGSLMLAALGFIKSTLMAHPEASARFL